MSGPPASYIVEQAHLQCSVYCVCPMLDVTQTSCLNCVYGTVHTTCAGFTHLLFAVQCQCASWFVQYSHTCYRGAWNQDGLDDMAHRLFSVCAFYDKLLTLAQLS